MSWKATSVVSGLTRARDGVPIPRDAKLVYMILAEFHNTTRRAVWPSVPEMAVLSVMSERHFRRQLTWLQDHGEIRRLSGGGAGRTSAYLLLRLDGTNDNAEQPSTQTTQTARL